MVHDGTEARGQPNYRRLQKQLQYMIKEHGEGRWYMYSRTRSRPPPSTTTYVQSVLLFVYATALLRGVACFSISKADNILIIHKSY